MQQYLTPRNILVGVFAVVFVVAVFVAPDRSKDVIDGLGNFLKDLG